VGNRRELGENIAGERVDRVEKVEKRGDNGGKNLAVVLADFFLSSTD
jgi:hypothetical protein